MLSYGGDSSTVQTQLKNVQQIQASYAAFAAILDDGSVVTWGDADVRWRQQRCTDSAEDCASRSKPLTKLLLPFLAMDIGPSSPGVMLSSVPTAALCRLS